MPEEQELNPERCAYGTWTNQKWPCSCHTSKCLTVICYKKERLRKVFGDGASYHTFVPPEFLANRENQSYEWVRSGYCNQQHCRHYVSADNLDVGVQPTLTLESPDIYNQKIREGFKTIADAFNQSLDKK